MGTALVAVGRLFPACRHFRHRRVMQRPRGASETPRGPRRRRGHPRCFFRPSRACCCRLSGGPYCRRGQSSGPLAVGGGAPPTVATTVVAVWRGATPASVAPRPLARRCCCRPRPLAWAVAALPACCRRPPRAVQQARRRCSPRLPPVSAVAVSALAVVSVALAVVVVVVAVSVAVVVEEERRYCCRHRGHTSPRGGRGTRPLRRLCMGPMLEGLPVRLPMVGMAAW